MERYFINISEDKVFKMNEKLWIWTEVYSSDGEFEVKKPDEKDILSVDEEDGGILVNSKKIVYVKKEIK